MQQFVPTTTTLVYSNFSRCCNVSTPSSWGGSSNSDTSKRTLTTIKETDNQNKRICDKVVIPEQKFSTTDFNLSELNIKQEPCQVAEISASDNINLEQQTVNPINDSNCPIYCTFTKAEGCQNNPMDNENTLQTNNEFTGVPIGFGYARQKLPEHLNNLNTPKDTNRFAVGIDLRNIENRNAPFAVNQEILINGTNSVIALNNENHNHAAIGMHNLRTSNSFWQYPIAVHESLLAMPFPSLGVQLMRDHNTGHLLFLPPSTAAIDTLHPTIVWPSFQQPPQTTQMPHIVFPSIPQTLPTPFAPLHLTGSDFLTSTTLHQHTQTQTRLVAVSTPDNKRKVVIGPKFQQNTTIKIEDKNEMKIECKSSEFMSNIDSKTCSSEKTAKTTLHFNQELKDTILSRVQQNKSTQLNPFTCNPMDPVPALTASVSQNNKNEISTTEISSSSEYMPGGLNNELFCYKGNENIECQHCPYVLERQDANIQTDNLIMNKEDDMMEEDEESLKSETENSIKANNVCFRSEPNPNQNPKYCEMEEDCENVCNKNRMANNSMVCVPPENLEEQKIPSKTDSSENCNSIAPAEESLNPIDLSGLELLSNISIEAIESKVMHLKKEDKKEETNDYCENQKEKETNNNLQESLENLESSQSTLGGLNLLCALAEQRIQEEGNNTDREISKSCKKERMRQKKRKIVRCNKIRRGRKLKYLKGRNENGENVSDDIRHVLKHVKSKCNYCDECRNKKFSEVSDCFHRDVKWPTAAEIFRAMELKMRRKLAAISQKCEGKKKELDKKPISNFQENNSDVGNHNDFSSSNNIQNQNISAKIKSRSPSPSNSQNEIIKFKSLPSILNNGTKQRQAHNILQAEIPTFLPKDSLKQKITDSNAYKKSFNIDGENKCISTSVNILPSVLGNNLASHSTNAHFNNPSMLVDHNNSSFTEESSNGRPIVLRLQKPSFNETHFADMDKKKGILKDRRLRKLLKNHSNSKKIQKHKLMKHKYIHMEEKKKIIDGHLRISDNHLKEPKVRVLTAMGGLFYAGYLQPIEPPDVYAVTLDGERGNKPHIMCREEVLRDVILEISPASINEVPQGTRICAYWSPQYRCLYPGTTVEMNEESKDGVFVSVEFDDGDSGRISLEDIRFLLSDYPIAGKKKSRKTEDVFIRNDNVPQLKTDNLAIERCKHHKIRKDSCIGFHYEHCKKHKQKCTDESCWPKKQKKKKKHKKHHRKRSTSLNRQVKHGESNLNYNEILTNDEFSLQEDNLKDVDENSNNDVKVVIKQEIETKNEKQCNKETEVKSERKFEKSNSKIAAFLPEKQLWQWLGDYFRRPGAKGRTKKKFYKSIQRGDETLTIGECAVFLSTDTDRPYIGKIQTMWETSTNNKVVRVRWFYHPEETVGCAKLKYSGGLFESSHEDENDVQTISHKCEVLLLNDYIEKFGVDPKKYSVYNNNDTYYYAGFYDPVTHKIKMQSDIPTSGDHQKTENFST
ncbi:protein winged eye isoform X2 [Condylostylus longicornis]|uniref:protein winged eye isoform X2 n=1 Tax=Condylostylus longicornis TaxID=2530218 RepID=UPI00244DC8E8|nr:protein winged eye isoform X2 [Condylostylus longicornis]